VDAGEVVSNTRDSLLFLLKLEKGFELEVPFRGLSGKRRFRWDAADAARKLAVEYQGIGRGHQWASAQAVDHEKLSEAALCGWRVIVCDAQSVNNGKCIEYIEAALREPS
jgi:hypothetical protein